MFINGICENIYFIRHLHKNIKFIRISIINKVRSRDNSKIKEYQSLNVNRSKCIDNILC